MNIIQLLLELKVAIEHTSLIAAYECIQDTAGFEKTFKMKYHDHNVANKLLFL